MNSTIFQDQQFLKDMFGVFRIYDKTDAVTWFANVKKFCIDTYSNPSELINYFHILIDKEFHSWLFKLESDKKKDLDTFEAEFIDKVFNLESSYESLVMSEQTSFLSKFNTMFGDIEGIKTEISLRPLSTFIKLKVMIIKKLYPKMIKEDAIRMTIFSISDDKTRKIFRQFLKSDLNDILNYAESIDLYK